MDTETEHMLVEAPMRPSSAGLPAATAAFLREGRARFGSVDCFDFVPCNYELVWRVLDSLPRARFCEWGSGFGIVTGLAEILGFEACGIEIDAPLADASRRLLADFGLTARIMTGDYLDVPCNADVYFSYFWPGKVMATEDRFAAISGRNAELLICYGQSDIRRKVKRQNGRVTFDRAINAVSFVLQVSAPVWWRVGSPSTQRQSPSRERAF